MHSGFCPARFGIIFCSVWSRLPIHTLIKLLDRAVNCARFMWGCVECDIAHRRSVAVLCMLYEIRCNQMQPPNGALPGPYVPVRVTSVALVAHRYTYAPPRCRTSQYRMTFIPSLCPSGTILLTPYLMVWDWRVSTAGPMLFYYHKLCSIPTIVFYYFYPCSFFCNMYFYIWISHMVSEMTSEANINDQEASVNLWPGPKWRPFKMA